MTLSRAQVVEIELANIKSSHELHCILMQKFDFPGWYGCNWDAFWDAITGLVEMPEKLVLKGWASFCIQHPSDATLMNECLNEMAEKYPNEVPEVIYA